MASISGAAITIQLGQGATTPAISIVTNPLSCNATTLTTADMNGDKNLDLILTCSTGYVVVMFGKGDGTFQTPAYYAVPGLTGSAQPVDLNGDGYPDIAVLGYQGTTHAIAILLNQGSNSPGTLAGPSLYTTTNLPSSIQAGDFNGDGKQDILTLGSTSVSSTFAVSYGNGDGTLQTQQTLQTPGGANSFLAVDVNQDGITDIVYSVPPSAFPSNPSIQVLLGSSSGQFTTGSNLPVAPYALSDDFYLSLGSAFKTKSNVVDLILFVNGHTSILNGDGKGNFALGQSYPYSAATSVIGSNGTADLLVSGGGILTTLPGNGDGTFSGILTTQPVPGNTIAVDVNGDGLTDIVSLDEAGVLYTALGRGNGTFTAVSQVPAQSGYALVSGDFNMDGNIDVATITFGNGVGHGETTQHDSQLILLTGNGDGTFQPAKAGVDLQVVETNSAVVGDFNGDGFLDVIAEYTNFYDVPPAGSGMVFVPGKGDGTFGTPVPFSQNSMSPAGPILTADLNNDKKLDLVWDGAVYLGNGDGTFRQIPLGLTGTPLALSDLNGDGFADIVIGTNIYAGNGDGTFQTSPFYTFPIGSPSSILIGDVNSDGHPDVAMQSSGQLILFLGDGNGHFADNGIL